MVKYVIKRLLLSILILLGVSMIIYGLVRVMPVDYLESKLAASLGSGGSDIEYAERLAEMKAYYGLDDESFVGICKGYWDWLVRFCQGDF
ncbi:MAG: diguanylate cyclase, partial [Clostridia bacterium]|nr:diguanylate cyclase [Clostridia bacterium]